MKVIFVSTRCLSLSGHLSPLMYVMTMFLPSKCGAPATAPTRIKKGKFHKECYCTKYWIDELINVTQAWDKEKI